jgi:zinc protease
LKQSEEEPSFVATKVFKNTVYGDLPYGRLIRGSIETIDRITREEIVRFHSSLYRPNNAVLSVVGDLTEDELSALINKFLSPWQRGEVVKRASVEKPQNKKRTLLMDRELTQANIIVGHAGIHRGNPDYYAVSVMNYILGGGGFSSRLMQKVRDEMGLAYDIHSFFAPYKEGGLFEVGVQTKNESTKTVISEIYSQMNRIKKDKVSEQELDDAKAYLTGSFPRKLDTNRKIADFLVAIEFYELGLDYVDKYPQYIRAVTGDDVLRVAGKYLDTLDMVTVVVGKQSKISLDNQ